MKEFATKDIRNIVLVGHAGCGKTTLAECMLYEAKAITRRGTVEDKNTVSDHYNIEKERSNSIFASLMHAEWKDSKINIIDTPGYDDFVGEVVAGLKVAGTAVMVLNAQNGVEVGTELLWEYIEKFKTPTLIAVNQLDHDKADYNKTLEQAQERFGDNVCVVQYPVEVGDGFTAIVDVLRMIMYKFPDGGGKPEKVAIPDSEADQADEYRAALIEKVAEYDDELMESYFENDTLTEEEMTWGLKLSMLNQELLPVFCVSAARNMGSGRIMGFLNDVAPAPIDRPYHLKNSDETIKVESEGKPALFIYKTLSEPHLGEISYFKVISGSLSAGDELYNHNSTTSERFSQVYLLNGKQRDSVEKLNAGDLGVVVKLKNSRTNDTLSHKSNEVAIEPIHYPEARIRSAVRTPNKKDIEKLAVGLTQLKKEDPTIIVEQSQELAQTIVYGQGELHLQIIKYRLEKLYNIEVEYYEPRIPYRETIQKSTNVQYRHKKQSGGSGQFAEVHMLVEPYYEGMPPPKDSNSKDLNVRSEEVHELKWGGRLVFQNCTFGGSIDTRFMAAIAKGLMRVMEQGPITGSYVRDIRVSVYDGKMHAVDSNDMAFMLAASAGMKKAIQQAQPKVLEPIYNVDILCTDESMGDIMSDLNTRRASITNMGTEGHYQKISAHIPLKELYKYSSTLRSVSQGRAKHHREFHEFAPVPSHLQEELAAAYRAVGATA